MHNNKFLAVFIILLLGIILPLSFNSDSVSAYTASISTNNDITLDILPSGDGTTIRSESINVATDCRAGYNLTIATPESSNLYQYNNGSKVSSSASFTAVDGTSALDSSNNTNKWGYTLTSSPTSSTIFSPLSSTASTIKASSETASPDSDINDTFNINYGIKVDNSVAPGNYQMDNHGAVVYYLTMDTNCTQYTVEFNPNGGTGTMNNQYIEPGVSTELSQSTFTSPALGSSYQDSDGNTITGTSTTYWKFNGWNTAADGSGTSYSDKESIMDLVAPGHSITLYAQWQATPALVVNYESNGMRFSDNTTRNTTGYLNQCSNKYVSAPSYSHTDNINDGGTQIGTTKYANNLATKDVITIPNADSLHATITYGTENNYDMLYVFEGEYTGSVSRNMNAGQLAKYMGGNNTTTTVELDIPGDTATFAFYSDGSGQYWGYHVTLVGYYDDEPESYATTTQVCTRELISGTYQDPAEDNDRLFKGWSENSSATTPDYTSADDIINNLPGNNNETKTLYAVWAPRYHINYVNNCMTYASDNTSCTQSTSSATSTQTINLDTSGNGSGTLADYNEWTLTGWKISGWNTAADGTGTEYPVSSTYQITGASAGDSITLYAHWVPLYSIQYDGNNADNPNGMGTTNTTTGVKSVTQTNVGEGDPVVLLASNFKKAGNGFAGWSTDPDAWTHFTDNDNTNDPVIYGPMETIDAPAYPTNGTNIITMYAVWVPAEKDGSNNPVYLQDWNSCSSLTSTTFDNATGKITASKNSIIALTDKRDDEVYTIAKLADNNCWMVENLRLEHEGTVGNNKNDSTVTNQSLSQGYGGTPGTYGSFVGLANPESANFSNSTTSLSFADGGIYKSSTNPPVDTYNPSTSTLEDIGTSDYPGRRFSRYNNSNNSSALSSPTFTENYANAASPSTSGTYKTSTISSYGNYYTWAAAMANTNHYEGASTSEAAGTSICPSGWHLPSSGTTTKEYGTLSQRYGGTGNSQSGTGTGDIMSNRFRSFPNNFLHSGFFGDSSANGRGSNGSYWSRSAHSIGNSYYLDLYSTTLGLSNNYSKSLGFSVRCLVDNTYTIQYDGNGADNPNGMGTTNGNNKSVKQNEISNGTKVTLLASNFKRNGYGFAGWSTDPDAYAHFTDNDNTNDPIIYGPMEDVVIDSSTFNNLRITMYAVWVPAEKDGNNNPVYLQDWNSCSSLTSTTFDNATGKITASKNSIIALTDKRDDEVYTIAKLADNNCWMVENLRLEHEGTVGNNKNDSTVTNQSLSQGYGGTPGTYGSFVGLANPESANFSNSTTSLSFANGGIYKSSSASPTDTYNSSTSTLEDIGTSNYPGYRFPRYNNSNNSSALSSPTYIENYANAFSPSSGTYKNSTISSYGNYYTWAAAMANTNYYDDASTSEAADTSICPSGWHLPSSDSTAKEYGTLSQGYGGSGADQSDTSIGDIMSNRFRSFPNNFLYSGYFDDSSARNRGSYGYYWSRSAFDSRYSYSLFLNFTRLYPSSYEFKYIGYSVRCLIGS